MKNEDNENVENKEDVKVEYFYTVGYPFRWGGTPSMITLDDNFRMIGSLEEAKALALQHRQGRPGDEDYAETTWGVKYF